MIKEYINKLLEENNQDLEKLEKQIKDLLGELSCAEEWSESLQISSNEQKNIFSPRNIDTEIETKMEKASISIQKINKEIEYVKDLIETHLKKKDEYQRMLDELENPTENVLCDEDKKVQNKLSEEYVKGFLSDIYSKTELCLAFLNSDKNKCKKELNEIKSKIKKYAEEIESK